MYALRLPDSQDAAAFDSRGYEGCTSPQQCVRISQICRGQASVRVRKLLCKCAAAACAAADSDPGGLLHLSNISLVAARTLGWSKSSEADKYSVASRREPALQGCARHNVDVECGWLAEEPKHGAPACDSSGGHF